MDLVLPSLLSALCFSGICFLLPCNSQRSCNVWRVRLHHLMLGVRAALLSFFSSGHRLSSLFSSLLPKSKSNLTSLPEKLKINTLHPANCARLFVWLCCELTPPCCQLCIRYFQAGSSEQMWWKGKLVWVQLVSLEFSVRQISPTLLTAVFRAVLLCKSNAEFPLPLL